MQLKEALDPLYDECDDLPYFARTRMLTDRGIRAAISQGLLDVTGDEILADPTRIQPTSIDMRVKAVEFQESVKDGRRQLNIPTELVTIPKLFDCKVAFTEEIDFWSFRVRDDDKMSDSELEEANILRGIGTQMPFKLSVDSRSSAIRLGLHASSCAVHSYNGNTEISLANLSPNDIHFEPNERVAQIFVHPNPYEDLVGRVLDRGVDPKIYLTERGNKVRSLDMGVEIIDEDVMRHLSSKSYMKLERKNGKPFSVRNNLVEFHAGTTGYRIKKIEGGVHFGKRKTYGDTLLEPINISRGIVVRPDEQLIINTEETFELSDKVGVRIWDNMFFNEGEQIYSYRFPKQDHIWREDMRIAEIFASNMTHGWIDPGYKGIFTRLPKTIGRRIRPGDVIGYGQVFYYPQGVEVPYGSEILGSQYSGQKAFQVAK